MQLLSRSLYNCAKTRLALQYNGFCCAAPMLDRNYRLRAMLWIWLVVIELGAPPAALPRQARDQIWRWVWRAAMYPRDSVPHTEGGPPMPRALRALIAGESWETLSFHQKGFDVFTTTFYYEGVGPLRAALEAAGHAVEYMPSHIAATKFPTELPDLRAFDVVLLSDIGSNTLLLHPDTFERSRALPNRLTLLREYVAGGGGLIMVGGYMTFQGIDAKARYAGTAVEAALPVTLLPGDD